MQSVFGQVCERPAAIATAPRERGAAGSGWPPHAPPCHVTPRAEWPQEAPGTHIILFSATASSMPKPSAIYGAAMTGDAAGSGQIVSTKGPRPPRTHLADEEAVALIESHRGDGPRTCEKAELDERPPSNTFRRHLQRVT